MKKFQKTTVLMVTILALVCFTLYGGEEKVVDKTFKALSNVKIKVVSGDCIFTKGGAGEIKVHLVYTFPDDRYKPIFKEEGDTLILEEEFSKDGCSSGKSKWTVTVPEQTAIDGKTASGDFSVAGIKGKIECKVASGDIVISEAKGEITAASASGDISVKNSAGEMELKTASGDIQVEKSEGAMELKCASGDIELTGVVFKGESEVKAVSGDVKIKLAGSLEYNLEISTVSGDVLLDYMGNPIKGHFSFSGQKENIKSSVPFDKKDESKYNPFMKAYFTKDGNSPEVSLKTVSGSLTLK
ncbi:MAG: DUF4097 domain-containing protein [Candidatus Aminicenantes bacterium]|nr:DUF4097 domain-containing protein [Candidatus Aminicenantes bacterium]